MAASICLCTMAENSGSKSSTACEPRRDPQLGDQADGPPRPGLVPSFACIDPHRYPTTPRRATAREALLSNFELLLEPLRRDCVSEPRDVAAGSCKTRDITL